MMQTNRKILKTFLGVGTIAALVALMGCKPSPGGPIGAGKIAPDTQAPNFKLPSLAKGDFELQKLRGKPVLLVFWASWCGPCVAEVPHLNALAGKHRSDGLIVLGVNADAESRSDIARFQRERKPAYPLLIDASGKASNAYGVTSLPTLVWVAPDGRIGATLEGLAGESELQQKTAFILP